MNSKPALLRLLCLRHGKTKYTGIFPDLTDEGAHQVRTEGLEQVQRWMNINAIPPRRLSIVSSPAPRALGTASIIKDGIGHTREIILAQEIEPLRWKDPERCAEIIKGMTGYIHLETEPRFADHTLFEPLHEVHRRLYKYITNCLDGPRDARVLDDRILVAHYETFCGIVTSLFEIPPIKETELRHVEAIELHVLRMTSGTLSVTGHFRGKTSTGILRMDGVLVSL